jgi:hypothetical protein
MDSTPCSHRRHEGIRFESIRLSKLVLEHFGHNRPERLPGRLDDSSPVILGLSQTGVDALAGADVVANAKFGGTSVGPRPILDSKGRSVRRWQASVPQAVR